MNLRPTQAARAIKTTECFRDAIQGLPYFVPSEAKVRCINALLRVGFDVIDCGSFVSPKAIPQMQDTSKVLQQLDLSETTTKLSVVVCNLLGAQMAVKEEKVSFIGYPISLSESFQRRNTNRSIEEALIEYKEIHKFVESHKQIFFPYLSMCFGNPYDEPFSIAQILKTIEEFANMGTRFISLADTSGVGLPDVISNVIGKVTSNFPEITFSAHLHTSLRTTIPNLNAARSAGCDHIETALGGLGGCPFATSSLMGNAPTEALIWLLKKDGHHHHLDQKFLIEAKRVQNEVLGVTLKNLILHSGDTSAEFEELCRNYFQLGDALVLQKESADHHIKKFVKLLTDSGLNPRPTLAPL